MEVGIDGQRDDRPAGQIDHGLGGRFRRDPVVQADDPAASDAQDPGLGPPGVHGQHRGVVKNGHASPRARVWYDPTGPGG